MARSVEFNETETIEKAMNVFWEKGYHGEEIFSQEFFDTKLKTFI